MARDHTKPGKQGRRRDEAHGHDLTQDDENLAAAPRQEITPRVERRILRLLNSLRTPDDLLRRPQRVRGTAGEHGPMHMAMEEELEYQRYGVPSFTWKDFGVDRDLIEKLIRSRPPKGYMAIKELDWDKRLAALLEILAILLGWTRYGNWAVPVPIDAGNGAVPIMNAALLHTGQVLLIPSGTSTLLWDPDSGNFEQLSSAQTGLTANLFCSGHSFLSDGRLLAVGGGGGGPGQASSIQAWKFDPNAKTWTKTADDMAYKRWYPTVVTLGDEPGRALVIAGWRESSYDDAPDMEIYDEASDSFSLVTVTGPQKVGPQTYPGMHMLPGGELFYAPVGFGDCGQSAAEFAGTEDSGIFVWDGPNSGHWVDTGTNVRTKGMSALLLRATYPFARVLVVGGGSAARSDTAQLINLSTFSPEWGEEFNLLRERVHPNVVLLPDGSAFICGGMEETGSPPNGGPCEMFDPEANTIAEMDELAYPRHYHSVALLLPSGKVMAAGGAEPGGCSLSYYNTIEVFSPPYLFKGTRPKITGAPDLVHHGDSFIIGTADAPCIAKVVLVRPMAVTHQTDTEQRVIQLEFHCANPDEIVTTMPDGEHPHGLAPRGYYLLFILSDRGVPSEGRFVYLH